MPYVHRWSAAHARCVVLIAHGYGEHAARYEHVARRLVEDLGAAVYAPDHRGHGRTDGATGTVADGEAITADLHDIAIAAQAEHPGLPVALIGHSMGGLIATRYAQRFGGELAARVVSGPAMRANHELAPLAVPAPARPPTPAYAPLLAMPPIPDAPIAPPVLSRAPAVGQAYPV